MRKLQKKIQTEIFQTGTKCGLTEQSPSYAQYFSWINNTNEGSTEAQTLANLDFFRWLYDEYGMILDIYAFDAGNLDGPDRNYGKFDTNKFRSQFPNGFAPIAAKARDFQCRLGMWGGPDGFGNTQEGEQARHETMVSLCRDHQFALFKFDGVCGQLRPSKRDAFIKMMVDCRAHVPDLIALNHRLPFGKAFPYLTTFLMGGKETYIDIHMANRVCAPHHREEALARAPPEDLVRLTEDHGVCISSCVDYWEDDLILQAFNRALILAPEIYGNPWLLPDRDYPKLARIYNLFRQYKDILVSGVKLPESQYGLHAVSRGDDRTRFITLRNLQWKPRTFTISLDDTIGLAERGLNRVFARKFHPSEKYLGTHPWGGALNVEVAPFRSYLLAISTEPFSEIGIDGCSYEIVRDVPGKPVEIKLLALPGTETEIRILGGKKNFSDVEIEGEKHRLDQNGGSLHVKFGGTLPKHKYHRKLAILQPSKVPDDAEGLYEATCFAADNNCLEIRELQKVGTSKFPPVQIARDYFFDQIIFKEMGIWDRNLFDGNRSTFFRAHPGKKIKGGVFRLDFGEIIKINRLRIWGRYLYRGRKKIDKKLKVEVSSNLQDWNLCDFTLSEALYVELAQKAVRYIRITGIVDDLCLVEGLDNEIVVESERWRASNLFAPYRKVAAKKAWTASFNLDEVPKNSYLAVPLFGKHGEEGAYVGLRIGDVLYGCPDRAPSFPSNVWESRQRTSGKNYTYYFPLNPDMANNNIEVVVLGLKGHRQRIKPEVWITAYPVPFEEKTITLF